MNKSILKNSFLFSLALLVSITLAKSSFGQEIDYMGRVELLDHDDIAERLKLSDDQKEKIQEYKDSRENAALDLYKKIKDSSPEDQKQQAAAFRETTEKAGLAFLNAEQITALEQIWISHQGMTSLTDPKIVEKLKLSDDQKQKIASLLEERQKELAAKTRSAVVVKSESNRAIMALLDEKQKKEWEALAGEGSAEAAAAVAENAPKELTTPVEAVKNGSAPTTTAATTTSAPATPATPVELPTHPGKIRFNCKNQPWQGVLTWFAQNADLSLVMDMSPPGTFNYMNSPEYTPAEAIDVMNSILLPKGFTLIRRERMLLVVNLADVKEGMLDSIIPCISLADLDKYGKWELVSVLFNLDKIAPEEAEPEMKKLLGPQGKTLILPKSRQIKVTDTAGGILEIAKWLNRIEDPTEGGSGNFKIVELKNTTPDSILPILRQMLGMPDDKNVTADGTSLRLAIDPTGKNIIATGTIQKLAQLTELVKSLDPPHTGTAGRETLIFKTYEITSADPQSVLNVMGTLLAGSPDVRLAVDPKTGSLNALARPSQQAQIEETLNKMQADGRRMETFRLRVLDPTSAATMIAKLLGAPTDSSKSSSTEKTTNPNAPQVEADPVFRRLIVRGTPYQLEQVRHLLTQLGELENGAKQGGFRMIQASPRNVEEAIQRIDEIWPNIHPKNKITVFRPSTSSASGKKEFGNESSIPQRKVEEVDEEDDLTVPPKQPEKEKAPPKREPTPKKKPTRAVPSADSGESRSTKEKSQAEPAGDKVTSFFRPEGRGSDVAERANRVIPVRWTAEENSVFAEAEADNAPVASSAEQANNPADTPANEAQKESAPINVTIGPNGVTIASDDPDALDEYEKLLSTLIGASDPTKPEMAVFYLKHAKAAVAAEILGQVFNGSTSTSGGGGGGMLGNIANAAFGGGGGDFFGAMLGLGDSGVQQTGTVRINPDERLNALIVQANSKDIDTIHELLKIVDQKNSPDMLVAPKPLIVKVENTEAEDIVDILRQVYSDRQVGTGQTGQNMGGMNPGNFFQQMMGGGRGGRGGQNNRGNQQIKEEPAKMSLSVDSRSNSIIITAPAALAEEVEALIKQLDVADELSEQDLQVVTLHLASPTSVEAALSAVSGGSITVNRTQASSMGSMMGMGGGMQRQGMTGMGMQNRGTTQGMNRNTGGMTGRTTGGMNTGMGGNRNTGGMGGMNTGMGGNRNTGGMGGMNTGMGGNRNTGGMGMGGNTGGNRNTGGMGGNTGGNRGGTTGGNRGGNTGGNRGGNTGGGFF